MIHYADLFRGPQALSNAVSSAPAARLRIHANARPGALRTPRRWLQALCPVPLHRGDRSPVRLSIADLGGHEVFATEHGGPLIVVSLPAGTYRVAVSVGAVRRRYTMTLEPGASFDLHVDLTPVRALSPTG